MVAVVGARVEIGWLFQGSVGDSRAVLPRSGGCRAGCSGWILPFGEVPAPTDWGSSGRDGLIR